MEPVYDEVVALSSGADNVVDPRSDKLMGQLAIASAEVFS